MKYKIKYDQIGGGGIKITNPITIQPVENTVGGKTVFNIGNIVDVNDDDQQVPLLNYFICQNQSIDKNNSCNYRNDRTKKGFLCETTWGFYNYSEVDYIKLQGYKLEIKQDGESIEVNDFLIMNFTNSLVILFDLNNDIIIQTPKKIFDIESGFGKYKIEGDTSEVIKNIKEITNDNGYINFLKLQTNEDNSLGNLNYNFKIVKDSIDAEKESEKVDNDGNKENEITQIEADAEKNSNAEDGAIITKALAANVSRIVDAAVRPVNQIARSVNHKSIAISAIRTAVRAAVTIPGVTPDRIAQEVSNGIALKVTTGELKGPLANDRVERSIAEAVRDEALEIANAAVAAAAATTATLAATTAASPAAPAPGPPATLAPGPPGAAAPTEDDEDEYIDISILYNESPPNNIAYYFYNENDMIFNDDILNTEKVAILTDESGKDEEVQINIIDFEDKIYYFIDIEKDKFKKLKLNKGLFLINDLKSKQIEIDDFGSISKLDKGDEILAAQNNRIPAEEYEKPLSQEKIKLGFKMTALNKYLKHAKVKIFKINMPELTEDDLQDKLDNNIAEARKAEDTLEAINIDVDLDEIDVTTKEQIVNELRGNTGGFYELHFMLGGSMSADKYIEEIKKFRNISKEYDLESCKKFNLFYKSNPEEQDDFLSNLIQLMKDCQNDMLGDKTKQDLVQKVEELKKESEEMNQKITEKKENNPAYLKENISNIEKEIQDLNKELDDLKKPIDKTIKGKKKKTLVLEIKEKTEQIKEKYLEFRNKKEKLDEIQKNIELQNKSVNIPKQDKNVEKKEEKLGSESGENPVESKNVEDKETGTKEKTVKEEEEKILNEETGTKEKIVKEEKGQILNEETGNKETGNKEFTEETGTKEFTEEEEQILNKETEKIPKEETEEVPEDKIVENEETKKIAKKDKIVEEEEGEIVANEENKSKIGGSNNSITTIESDPVHETKTDINGDFIIPVNLEGESIKIEISDGIDITTEKKFTGILSTILFNVDSKLPPTVNPLTTLVSKSLINEGKVTKQQIKKIEKNISDALNINPNDIHKDYISDVNISPDLAKAAVNITTLIELSSSDDKNEAYETLSNKLNDIGKKDQKFDDNITQLVVDINKTGIDSNIIEQSFLKVKSEIDKGSNIEDIAKVSKFISENNDPLKIKDLEENALSRQVNNIEIERLKKDNNLTLQIKTVFKKIKNFEKKLEKAFEKGKEFNLDADTNILYSDLNDRIKNQIDELIQKVNDQQEIAEKLNEIDEINSEYEEQISKIKSYYDVKNLNLESQSPT